MYSSLRTKYTRLLTILLALYAYACGNQTKETPEEETQTTEAQAEETEWVSLFDGETMSGWRTYQNKENDSWEVVDGTLHCKSFDDAKLRADLISEKQYENFELVLEWKISHQGNSGIIYRA